MRFGYVTRGDSFETLNVQIASISAASSDAAELIGDAVESMREKTNLLLGDL